MQEVENGCHNLLVFSAQGSLTLHRENSRSKTLPRDFLEKEVKKLNSCKELIPKSIQNAFNLSKTKS